MKELITDLKRKILMALGIGILRIIDDTKKIQKVQISLMENETHNDVDRYQDYGFSSVPVSGCQALLVSLGGSRDNSIVIATEDTRYRPINLNAGEVVIYNNFGDKIHFKQNRIIEITAPNVKINGNLQVTGDILDNSGTNTRTVAGMRSQYNGHTHPGGSTPSLPM
jgi:phage gp45-like